MKKIQLFALGLTLVILLQNANAQGLVDKWSTGFSNPNGPGAVTVNDVLTNSDGDTYVLATVFTGGDYDAYLIKYDDEGTKSWEKSYSTAYGDSEEYGLKLQEDPSGNIYALININPDDFANGSVVNGYTVRKYNSSGTLLNNYESVGNGIVKYGGKAADFLYNDYTTDYVLVSYSKYDNSSPTYSRAYLQRLNTSLVHQYAVNVNTFEEDDFAGAICTAGAEVLLSSYSSSTVSMTGYIYNFSSSFTYTDAELNISKNPNQILTADFNGSLRMATKNTDGTTSLIRLSGDIVNISSPYSVNKVLLGSSTYVTGSKTVSGHEELVLLKYGSDLSLDFESLLDVSHGSLSTAGSDLHINDNNLIDVGGTVIDAGSVYTGSVTFNSVTGVQQVISPYTSFTSYSPQSISKGPNEGNILVAETGTGIRLYSQCDPPVIDLGADFTSTEGDTETLGSDLPSGMTYDWSTGASTKTIDVTVDGTYSVTVTNSSGCSASDDVTIDFLLPAPDAPKWLQPELLPVSGNGSPNMRLKWANDDPLATSHVFNAFLYTGGTFDNNYGGNTVAGSTADYELNGDEWRFQLVPKNDDDVTGGGTTFLTFRNCGFYDMTTLETYISGLSLNGTTSVSEAGGTASFNLSGFTPAEDELNSYFEWTLPSGWTISEYNKITITADVAPGASSGVVSVRIVNPCTEAATSALTRDVYVIKDQTITFDQPSNLQVGDAAIDLGATASSSLVVSYSLSNANAELSGSMLTTKQVGDVTITASQDGNEEYNASPDVERTITISKGDDAITFNALSDVVWNAANFDLDTDASSKSGRQITWAGSDPSIATVSSTGVVNPIKPGTITITASLSGTADWNAPSNVQQTLTVLKADQTITFDPLPTDKEEGDQNFNLSAYASTSSGLTLSYQSSNTNAVTISNGQVQIVGEGTATITASQSGNDFYSAAGDVQQSISVTEGLYIWEGGIWNFGESVSPSFDPNTDDNVEIRENYAFSIQGSFEAKNLTITASGSVSVNSQSTLEVTSDLINNGSLTIQSGSSLITYFGNNVSDNILFNRKTRYADGKYSFVGSPVENDPSITGSDLGTNVYRYDESQSYGANGSARWVDASSDQLARGIGYTQANQRDLAFTGRPNSGTINVLGTYTGTYNDGTNESTEGWTLLSNPYPAAINVESFLTENNNIEGAVYFWDDNGSDSQRGTNNDYVAANATVAINTTAAGGQTRYNQHIGSAQGFFVKLKDDTDTDITFLETMRVAGENDDANFFRNAATPIIRINLQSAEGLFKQTVISIAEDAQEDQLVRLYDAPSFNPSSDDGIYSMKTGRSLAITGMPSDWNSIQLQVNTQDAGDYQIAIQLENYDQGLYLKDNLIGEVVDLRNGAYSFYAEAGINMDRFILTSNPTNVLALEESDVFIYTNNSTLHIQQADESSREYQLFNMNGKILLSTSVKSKGEVNLAAYAKGIYLVFDGEKTHKIILD
ncbi:MAG: T9SS type A sorting domain-containing protein [Ekhidna sp.]